MFAPNFKWRQHIDSVGESDEKVSVDLVERESIHLEETPPSLDAVARVRNRRHIFTVLMRTLVLQDPVPSLIGTKTPRAVQIVHDLTGPKRPKSSTFKSRVGPKVRLR